MNIIWGFLIISGLLFSLFTGNIDSVNEVLLNSCKETLDLIIKIFPIMALWLGIMNIAMVSGLLNKFAKLISPVLNKLFPEIPKGHKSLSYIATNIVVNMFGLGNVATPFGLKAMESLQELNKNKDTASNSMVTFLVLNTSGLTVIPTTIISMRMLYGSISPTSIILPCIIATTLSTVSGVLLDKIINRRKNDGINF